MTKVLPLLALVALTGCNILGGPGGGGGGGAPDITLFEASPSTINAPGESVVLSWTVAGAVTSLELDPVGSVTGSNTTVNPTQTTIYTLTASNSSGSDMQTTQVTVSSTAPPPPPPDPVDTTPPSGTFGVSASPDGPFLSDSTGDIESPSDERVLNLEAGDTFYAQVAYGDAGGIAGVTIRLVNSSPPGLAADLVQGQDVSGFTLVGPVGDCDLSSRPTNLTCVYEIEVGDISNIDQLEGSGGEFAYVFRTYVTDVAGNTSEQPIRGYVTVGDGGGTPTPPLPEPTENRAPTAAFTVTAQDENTFSLNGTSSSDPDGDALSYAWDLGDGSTANTGTVTKSYGEDGTYSVRLTVTDPDGLSDSVVQSVTVGDAAEEPDGFTIESFTVNGASSVTVGEGDELEFTWTLSGDEPSFLLLSENASDGSTAQRRIPAASGGVTLTADESAVYELSATDGSTEDPPSVEVVVE